MAKRTIYRDKRTGRFAKKSAWKISRTRGANNYVRQQVITRKTKPSPPPRVQAPPTAVYEWIVGFTYNSGRSFDVIVTATDETEAFQVAREFLAKDVQGQRLVRAGFSGWTTEVARGKRTNEEAGEAEYRYKSKK